VAMVLASAEQDTSSVRTGFGPRPSDLVVIALTTSDWNLDVCCWLRLDAIKRCIHLKSTRLVVNNFILQREHCGKSFVTVFIGYVFNFYYII
jgi:hypothetical protein